MKRSAVQEGAEAKEESNDSTDESSESTDLGESDGRWITVLNLHDDATSDNLWSIFEQIGPIERAYRKEEFTYGHVLFAIEEDAADAIAKFSGVEFLGLEMEVKLREESPPTSDLGDDDAEDPVAFLDDMD